MKYQIKDFTPIGLIASQPLVLVASQKSGVKTLGQFLTLVKENPGKFSYGSSGVGTSLHLAGEMVKQQGGLFMTHIPYRGVAPLTNDLLGNNIDFGVTWPGTDDGSINRHLQQLQVRCPRTIIVYRCILVGFQRFVIKHKCETSVGRPTIEAWLHDRATQWPMDLVLHRTRIVRPMMIVTTPPSWARWFCRGRGTPRRCVIGDAIGELRQRADGHRIHELQFARAADRTIGSRMEGDFPAGVVRARANFQVGATFLDEPADALVWGTVQRFAKR